MTSKAYAPGLTIGPRVRKSPFFDATVRAGARTFSIYNHVYMPTCYSDPVSEYWNLVNDVVLWDVSCERQIEITGPDALRFTELLTPRNVADCQIGCCRYVLLVGEDGGIVNDAVFSRLGEQHFWLSPGDGDVLLWAQGIAAAVEMDVVICEPDASPLQLQGPKAPDVAFRLFGDIAYELGYFHICQLELDGIPLAVSRTGWSGELGYELYLLDSSRGDELWDRVMSAGEPFGITPGGPNAIRSIEGYLLSYCSDITRADDPWTVGLGRLVDLDKPADFIGKAALQKIHAKGVRRRLVGIEIDAEPIAGNDSFWPVSRDGIAVGKVSRCAYSPRLKKNIGLANVLIDAADQGTSLTIEASHGNVNATVVPTPWFVSQTKIERRC